MYLTQLKIQVKILQIVIGCGSTVLVSWNVKRQGKASTSSILLSNDK